MWLTRVSQRRGYSGILLTVRASLRCDKRVTVEIPIGSPNQKETTKQPVKNAKDLVAISKKLKPNEKILMRVYSQGRSGYVALEPK